MHLLSYQSQMNPCIEFLPHRCAFATGPKTREVAIVDRMTSVSFEQVYLKLSEELSAGSMVDLRISFSGKLNDNMYGFYRSSYKTKTGDRRSVSLEWMMLMILDDDEDSG